MVRSSSRAETSGKQCPERAPATSIGSFLAPLPAPPGAPPGGVRLSAPPPRNTSGDFGIHLGTLAARGERGALIVSLDSLLRMSPNPFFPYPIERIEEGIGTAPRMAVMPARP